MADAGIVDLAEARTYDLANTGIWNTLADAMISASSQYCVASSDHLRDMFAAYLAYLSHFAVFSTISYHVHKRVIHIVKVQKRVFTVYT